MRGPASAIPWIGAAAVLLAGSARAQEHHHPPQPSPAPASPAPSPAPEAGAPVPPLTDEDRRAAFPDVAGHTVHDRAIHYSVLFDQLEWRSGEGGGLSLDATAWVGGDINRLWLRTEGETEDGGLAEGEVQALYGRAIGRWWDLVAGIRQDPRPRPGQTWAAVGIQGLAPYWFEVEATGYVGEAGRTQLRLEVEYELLVTNRLVLQPQLELELHGKSIPELGIGSGLSSTDAGLRLRYEVRREIAPYVGLSWTRRHGGTAELARAAGEEDSGTRWTFGLRAWF